MLNPSQAQLPAQPSLGLRLHYADASSAAVLRLPALIKQHLTTLTGQSTLAPSDADGAVQDYEGRRRIRAPSTPSFSSMFS
jgi:hypothetical protein